MIVAKKALVWWLALAWIFFRTGVFSFRTGVFSKLQVQQVLPAGSTAVNVDDAPDSSLIPMVCQATRFPDLCISSLGASSKSGMVNSTEVVKLAIDLGWIQERDDSELVKDLLQLSALDLITTSAALVCEETLDYGATLLATSRDSLLLNPIEDIQAWLSAALQFHYDCFSALSNVVRPPDSVVGVIIPQLNLSMQLISNALCMADALAAYGSMPSGWRPPPEKRPANLSSIFTGLDASAEWSSQTFELQSWNFSDLLPDVIVSQDGSSNCSSVQEAVDNAPAYNNERYIIYIKEGIYSGTVRVHQNKTRLMFVGDGLNKTILTGNNNASSPETCTFQTASVVIVGDRFAASGITFQNSAGPDATQAVAIRVDSDLSAFQDCLFDGYQDTLYAHTGRQFYRNCIILGTVDFIFGNAAAVFLNCQVVVKLNRPSAKQSFVTAQGRTDPGQTTGLVFQNCSVTGTADYVQEAHQVYLGRPWKLFSRTIFVSTYLDSLIDPTGWFPWRGDFALDSLLYGEYASYGPGVANLSSRVPWSNQLTEDESQQFSINNFIQGRRWLPGTDLPSNDASTTI